MEFQVFHKYNQLVRRGMALPLRCPNDDSELSVMMGPGDEPMLRCFVCGDTMDPGVGLYSRIRAVVSEHYV